ncbi:MAG: hypothetical protein IMZ53_13065 [Thermoplasmata archaeon]|nr:hypothetical protein [Thermoplasmata archaeon]
MESTPNIELSEKMYKRVEMLLRWQGKFVENLLWLKLWIGALILRLWSWVVKQRPKQLRIIGIEFLTKEGKPFHFHLGEKYHIDNHSGTCTKDMHCLIVPIKKISVSKNKVKVFYEGDHEFVYSQVSIRTTYLKKV